MWLGPTLAIIGLALLVVAAQRLVRDAAAVSLALGLPAVVVGAVVIGFGTSLPELLASASAAASGERALAIGSVVGSNIANLSLVVGIIGLVAAPRLPSRVIFREAPVATAAVLVLALVLPMSRLDGAVLLGLFLVMAAVILVGSRRSGQDLLADEVMAELPAARGARGLALGISVALVGTAAGAHVLVEGARRTADDLGISGGLVGFTLVALGTTAPEIVAAVQASRHGAPDLALGNVLGSNIFNALLVGGVVGLMDPGAVPSGLVHAAWLTVPVSALAWSMMWRQRALTRGEGAVLLCVYVAALPLVA